MAQLVKIGQTLIGENQPTYVIGEIGINHNGDIEIAKKLIDVAALSGCNAVKFQKRTPELCVPEAQKNLMRETPWGIMTYMDYRYRVEFGEAEYAEIDKYCKQKGVTWFASCWDEPSVDFIEKFDPACYKIASAAVTNDSLIRYHVEKGRPSSFPPVCRQWKKLNALLDGCPQSIDLLPIVLARTRVNQKS
nr:N-acetylneuraminate synthase family protein [Desulfosarcina cetonica]